MSDQMFISQAQLEAWIEKEEADFSDMRLRLPAQKKEYAVTAAVRVSALIDGTDAANLMGQVKTMEELQALGAEYCQGTVILGDVAYGCEEGFVGVLQTTPEVQESPATAPAQEGKPADESDALAEFLLKNLS